MRKSSIKPRQIPADALYNNLTVAKLINKCMYDGKKDAARRQVYAFLDMLKAETKQDPVVYLEQALDNIRPKVEVRPRRIGGSVYQVPTPVRAHRQMSLSLRWLVDAARALPNKQYHSFQEKLFAEIKSAFANQGSAVTKRTEVERMAEANKAFAHLHW